MTSHPGTSGSIRFVVVSILAGAVAIALLASGLGVDRAAAQDAAAVRGYIVQTPNNPDVDPANTCAGRFLDNDVSDRQPQSPAGSADNAVTLAGCIYDSPPFGGPSTLNYPAAFEVVRGPGGLLCPGQGIQQSQACPLSGINFQPGAEYRVQANNEVGKDATSPPSMLVEFCADDPPVQGRCGIEDEEQTQYTILWEAGAASDFTLGKVTKNKKKGTAKLEVEVPGPGELELAKSKKVKGASKGARAAGTQKLPIKPKGKAKKQLAKKGKAKVRAKVTYTPDGGAQSTKTKSVKLVKRG